MHTSSRQPALQEQTLCFYGELMARELNWAGKLVIAVGENCASGALSAACSLAGATSLLFIANVAEAKAILRDGGIDFLVTTVDEALRALKNEIRQGRSLAVVVTCDVPAGLGELMERGVLPDLFLQAMDSHLASESSAWAGVRKLEMVEESPTEVLRGFLCSRGLSARTWSLPGRAAVRAFDRELLELISVEDDRRRRWLTGIARYQRSADQDYRTCWVTEVELDQLADVLTGQAL